jgi:tetratricopeptide (TPR) repeat protein
VSGGVSDAARVGAGARRPDWRAHPRAAALALTVLVAAAVYANALGNGFTLDDRAIVLDNPRVHSIDGMWRAFAHPYWPEAHGAGQYRPLVVASFAVDWAVSGGSAAWLHAVNVVWHVAATAAVFLLLAELLAPAGALAGALLFAVHPVHVEAVANVVGRAECMAAAFTLAALLAHRRGRRWAPLCFALALASKENAVVFLGLAAAHDALLAGGGARRAFRERARLYAAYAGVATVYAGALVALFRGQRFVAVAPTWRGAGVGERLLTVLSVVPHYARLLVAPFDLSVDYQPRHIELARTLTPAAAVGLCIVLAAAALAAAEWRRRPLVAFAVAWFAVAIAPVSNVLFPSGVVLAERTLYLPSVAASLVAGLAADAVAARRSASPAPSWARVALGAAAAAVLVAFAARAWTRTPTWASNKALILTALAEHPESYMTHQVAGRVYFNMGDYAAARREYAIARELFQGDAGLYRDAATVSLAAGELRESAALLDTALAAAPDHAEAWLRLGDLRYRLGDYPRASVAAARALLLAPDSTRAAVVVAKAAEAMGDLPRAERVYARALAHRPQAWELRAGHAQVLSALGDTTRARREAALADTLRAARATGAAARPASAR